MGQLRFLLIGPLGKIRVKQHQMTGVFIYMYERFILKQFGSNGKGI